MNTLHPGGIMINLKRHLDQNQVRCVGALGDMDEPLIVPLGWKTPGQGAATPVLLAA